MQQIYTCGEWFSQESISQTFIAGKNANQLVAWAVIYFYRLDQHFISVRLTATFSFTPLFKFLANTNKQQIKSTGHRPNSLQAKKVF